MKRVAVALNKTPSLGGKLVREMFICSCADWMQQSRDIIDESCEILGSYIISNTIAEGADCHGSELIVDRIIVNFIHPFRKFWKSSAGI